MHMTHVTLITSWKALKVLVTQLFLTLCDHMDCSPSGSSVHGILQARILEWVAISFSGDLLDPGIEPGSPTLQAEALLSEPPGKPRRHMRCGFNPWVVKIPWRRTWYPTSVLLLGKSHGQRSLVGYSPWGSDMTETAEHTHTHTHTHTHPNVYTIGMITFYHTMIKITI